MPNHNQNSEEDLNKSFYAKTENHEDDFETGAKENESVSLKLK